MKELVDHAKSLRTGKSSRSEVTMDSRKLACMMAAGFVGVGLISAASSSSAKPREVVVEGQRIDPALQRRVSYADLNLATRPDQRTLDRRIYRTADDLCFDLNGTYATRQCTSDAVHSTDDQVAAAIDRAKRQMAGLPVGPAVAISIVIGAR
jgi:UrcA family protein